MFSRLMSKKPAQVTATEVAAAKVKRLQLEQLDDAYQVFIDPARHAELDGACLELPDGFDLDLDPELPAFREQQMRLWREITGRTDYDPEVNEITVEIPALDAIYRPAFYSTGDASLAGMNLRAMGHILSRSGVKAGSRVIEYGAGFGQNALAFARLGAKVDTVDISAAFCRAVRGLADRYHVDLTAHHRPFGFNPSGASGSYDLILFYESFHHCWEFQSVIPRLREMLSADGRILLAGEPIVREPHPLMPYPWGIRLDWQNVAVMRHRGWMELGFQENYLVRQFANAGMTWAFHPDPLAETSQIYEFRPWTDPMRLDRCHLTRGEASTWNAAQPDGRWTTAESLVGIPSRDGGVEISIHNHHYAPRAGRVALGNQSASFKLDPGEHARIRLRQFANERDQRLIIASNAQRCSEADPRILGVCVDLITPI